MTDKTFTINQPTRLMFGAGAISDLASLVRDFGGSKPFVVVDPGLKNAGLLDRITAPLKKAKMKVTVYDKVDPEPGLKLTGW